MVSREAQGNFIHRSHYHSQQAALGNLVVAQKSPFGERSPLQLCKNRVCAGYRAMACEAVYGLGYTPDCIDMPRLTLNSTVC